MRIEQTAPQTFRLVDGSLDALANRLRWLGLQADRPRTPYEHSRWWQGRRTLVVLYHSGAIVAQGRVPADARALLEIAAAVRLNEAGS